MMFFNKNSSAPVRGAAAMRGASPLSPRFARLVRESIWFAIVALLAYVALILASYSPGDPAWSYSGDGSPIVNRGGAIGAWLADLLLYLFGISAWWLVVAGVAITIASFRRIAHPELETDHPRWLGTIGFALVLVASSAIEALRFWKLGATLPIGPGGAIGDALGSMLTRGLGYNGATLLLVAAFLGGFSLFSGLSWLKLMERIGAALEGLVAWARRKREVRLILIDPKMLELSVYEGIPHLLAPVVTDMKLAPNALNWCVGEMERRYRLMSQLGVRNLAGYNQKVADARKAGKPIANPVSLTPESPEPLEEMPLIVVVVDELADLMMVTGRKIEELIARIAQKARAAGIHLILATQRPSVDVITGLIKANIPSRIAFQVASKVDSRTILDQMGAEALLGQGDMLYLPPGTGYPLRVHGAFVSDGEVHRVVEHLKATGAPQYVEGVLEGGASDGEDGVALEGADAESDPMYDQAVAVVLKTRRPSISLVQRHLRIGYNRAARLIEQMERSGLVSPMQANGNREVLAPAPKE